MTSKDKELEAYLKGRTPLSQAYRAGAREVPPSRLDAAIFQEAHQAVAKRPRVARSPFGAHWFIPLSAAAVIVLTVGLVVFMGSEQMTPLTAPDERPRLTPEVSATAPPAVAPAAAVSPEAPALSASPAQRTAPREAEASKTMPVEPKLRELRLESASVPSATGGAASTLSSSPQRNVHDKREQAMTAASADVISVEVSGQVGAYQFAVGIKSPDTGCAQYADWWEVVSLDGKLLYRRVLLHSHADEQPFVRGGGPVPIQPDTLVWVRAHMQPGGYGGVAFKGSVRSGFQQAELSPAFAVGLAQTAPRPEGCDF
jgi:hypothetical protein